MLFKACALLVLGAAQVYAQQSLRVISFNIRYDNTDLDVSDVERYWLGLTCAADPIYCRAPGLIHLLQYTVAEVSDVAIIGLQEVLENQLSDIMVSMGSNWASIGVGRDDGYSAGEFNPIIYRPDTFEIEHWETKWLSLTPDTPSKDWGSGSNRIVTIAVMKHIATGRRFIHANTHLDNESEEARTNQIGVAVDMVKAVDAAYGPDLPTILNGDFNSASGGGAYKTLLGDAYLDDMYNFATAAQRSGEFSTYTGFSDEFNARIDYIWVGPKGKNTIGAVAYKTLDNDFEGGKVSDHRAVVADITLN